MQQKHEKWKAKKAVRSCSSSINSETKSRDVISYNNLRNYDNIISKNGSSLVSSTVSSRADRCLVENWKNIRNKDIMYYFLRHLMFEIKTTLFTTQESNRLLMKPRMHSEMSIQEQAN